MLETIIWKPDFIQLLDFTCQENQHETLTGLKVTRKEAVRKGNISHSSGLTENTPFLSEIKER